MVMAVLMILTILVQGSEEMVEWMKKVDNTSKNSQVEKNSSPLASGFLLHLHSFGFPIVHLTTKMMVATKMLSTTMTLMMAMKMLTTKMMGAMR